MLRGNEFANIRVRGNPVERGIRQHRGDLGPYLGTSAKATTFRRRQPTAAAANPHTGNAAVAQKNSNGVTTTQTTNGGKAKTKNGMGVSPGLGDTDCAKGKNHQGCTTKK